MQTFWFRSYVQGHTEELIDEWVSELGNSVSRAVNRNELVQNARKYILLLIDLNVALAEHPAFEVISRMCAYYLERGTPLPTLLESSYIWRKVVLTHFWRIVIQEKIAMEYVAATAYRLNERIDEVQRAISDVYWETSRQKLKKQEQLISEMHNDRLSLLGKMAASMAHELRNPLFAIEGFVKLIKNELSGQSSDRVNHYIEIILNEFQGLYGHITGFLSFSKNSGIEEPFQLLRLDELAEPVLRLVQPRMINENVELTLDLAANGPIYIQKVAFQQVLSNLINNSIDALEGVTKERRITITSEETKRRYYIRVSDTGPGIPVHIRPTIFNPFVTSKNHGTGLGLSVCKQIMEKNGGDITFTTSRNGTEFTLVIKKNSAETALGDDTGQV